MLLTLQGLNHNDSSLMNRHVHLRGVKTKFKNNQKGFVKQQRHIDTGFELPDKIFLFSSKPLFIESIFTIITLW